MNDGVQSLDATAQYLRRPGNVGYLLHLQPGLRQLTVGAAGAHQFVAQVTDGARELHQAGLVIYAE